MQSVGKYMDYYSYSYYKLRLYGSYYFLYYLLSYIWDIKII